MKKGTYLLTLVGLLTITSLIETVTGFVLWLVIPSGSGRGVEQFYWGLSRHAWIDIHDWVAVILTLIVLIHLLLHWKWVVCSIKHLSQQIKDAIRSNKTASPTPTH